MATGLVETIAICKPQTSKLEKRPNGRKLDLLLKWCNSIFDHLMTAPGVDENEETCLAVLELIRAHSKCSTTLDVEDIITCMATWCIAALPPSFSNRDLKQVTTILLGTSPSKSAYSTLISRIFSFSTEDDVPIESLNQIRSFSRTLRLHGLFTLEVLFINQTRSYFDTTFSETLGHEPEFEEIMGELEKDTREAEAIIRHQECGSSDDDLDSIPPPTTNTKVKKRKRSREKEALAPRKRVHFRPRPDLTFEDEDEEDCLFSRPVRTVTYDDSDQTPEVEFEIEGDDDEVDDEDTQLAVSVSLQMSSSDDLLDLFACPNTSPVVLRRRNG